MKDIEYRLAKKADLAKIAEFSRDYIEHGLGWSWTPERVRKSYLCRNTNIVVACGRLQEQPRDAYRNIILNKHQNKYQNKHQGEEEILGFGIMNYGATEANLNLLAVVPQYRRMGIATDIVLWLEKCALIAGVDVVFLQCRTINTPAQQFYQKLGYRKLRSLPKYYSHKESAVLMGHDLLLRTPNLFLQRPQLP